MGDMAAFQHGESLSIATLMQQPASWKDRVLGAICFSADAGEREAMQNDADIPCMAVSMQRLDGSESCCEIWHGGAQLKQGCHGDIRYRHDGDVLFGVIELTENAFPGDANKTPLQHATESAYRQIFALLDALDYPYLFRFWNYIADINAYSFELERYRQFNLGRQDAFLAHGRAMTGNVPAACALGSPGGPLTIAFLAGRVRPAPIENPRQISAYQYPPQYGPRSPVFARASLVRMGEDEVLFISGTASIVGHETLHPGDVVAQTHETMTNIEAVLSEANRIARQPRFNLVGLHYKVYVRHAADLPRIRSVLEARAGHPLQAVYLQADVCREDLLVEIEATATHASGHLRNKQG